jgi:hypothetical protein
MSFALAKAIHGQESNRNMLVLFDPGSMLTWISSNKLPEGTKGDEVPPLIGIAGQFNSNKTFELTNLCFPQFYITRYFSSDKARVLETSCHYDMVIGWDMLPAMGLIVDFKDNLMTWDAIVVAMKMYPKKPPLPNEPLIVSQMILDLIEDDLITTDECLSSNILQSKYEPSNIQQITQGQKQLTLSQRNELEEILLKFPKLFSGGLGKFNSEKIHLNLDPTVPSVASLAYSVPERHKHIFKLELSCLVQEGVLEPGTQSAWIAGTFIILYPRKTDVSIGYPIFAVLIRLSNEKYILYLSSATCYIVDVDTNTSQKLISQCSITVLK